MKADCMLWYRKPAEYWEEALPVGNGRLGAMVYGKTGHEVIQLNEESLWSGSHGDRLNPDFKKNLGTLRALLHEGRIGEAEQLATMAMAGVPQYMSTYETLGNLHIRYYKKENKRIFPVVPWEEAEEEVNGSYQRSLDLRMPAAVSGWCENETEYRQEIFASHPADALVLRITAKGRDKLNLLFHMERGKRYRRCGACDSGDGRPLLMLQGNNGGMEFAGGLKLLSCDGKAEICGEYLKAEASTEVVLAFTAFTSYRRENPAEAVEETLGRLAGKTFEELRNEHFRDYQKLYGRMEISFGRESENQFCELPTDQRLERMRSGEEDPSLMALYFQYGRYLMIAGSREGGLPLTLQGIWNEDFDPMWDSKYTININLQMNYWPVDIVNLSECSEPFFSLLKRVAKNGKRTAREMYGCRGFTAHHNTDIYADTEPQENYIPASFWPMGGAWLSTHIWDHYLFTKEKDFLKELYPVLRDAVLFFADYLREDEDGYLRTSPSCSPENTYLLPNGESGCLTEGSTMDNQILYRLFSDGICAAAELEAVGTKDAETEQNRDSIREYREFGKLCKELREKLPPVQVGSKGQILEWKDEYEEPEPGHRHISHVYGVYPGDIITFERFPELMQAARRSVELRLANGGGYTGWSRAWITILWARFRDQRMAWENLRALLAESTYINLMDFHPMASYKRGNVFQIDGNLGGVTAIAEMLVQSHGDQIVLLPALPEALSDGEVKGLCVRGGGELSMVWKDGKLKEAVLTASHDMKCRLCYEGSSEELDLKVGEAYVFPSGQTHVKQ